MRSIPRLITLLIGLLPLSTLAVELRWNSGDIEKLTYKTALEADITGVLGELDSASWGSNPAEFDRVIERLKTLPLKDEYMHFRTQFKPLDGGRGIRVRMIGVPVTFDGAPADEQEAELREKISAFVGALYVKGDMDRQGRSRDLTFYRVPTERQTLTQFFYLPEGDLTVGDHWRLPVNFIVLGPGFFVQKALSHNRVTLTALRPSPAGRVAELRYLVSDRVEGYAERMPGAKDGQHPFSMSVAFFGFGEFLVEEGRWLRQVTVTDYGGSGVTELHMQRLFALELEEGGGEPVKRSQ
jgi:hypothetical protein